MRNQVSVLIDRPIEEVFRLTADDVAKWSIVVVEDEVIEEKNGGGLGTTFRCVTEDRGNRMEFQGVVTEYDPPNRHAIHLTGEMFDIESQMTFEDVRGRTRVTQVSCATGKGVMRLMLPVIGWFTKKSSCQAAEAELNSLRSFCETGAAITSE